LARAEGHVVELIVEITRFVDDHFPGIVECAFLDAGGRRHLVVDKVPVFTLEDLFADSVYPRPGIIRCQIEREWTDEDGCRLAFIRTENPSGVETAEGLSTFTVLRSQLSPSGRP
jgi:hypothetical protein